MKAPQTIRKFLAGLMLLLFSFSMTPRIYLHDWMANHHDTYGQRHQGPEKISLSQAGFQCDTQDQVVSTPYIGIPEPPRLNTPLSLTIHINRIHSYHHSSRVCIRALRGPPAANA